MSADDSLQNMIQAYLDDEITDETASRALIRLTADRIDEIREAFIEQPELLETLKSQLVWGTLGRQADNDEHERKKLRNLSTSHLENILITQRQISIIYSLVIIEILKDRTRVEHIGAQRAIQDIIDYAKPKTEKGHHYIDDLVTGLEDTQALYINNRTDTNEST